MDDDQKDAVKAVAEAALQPFTNLIERLFGGAVDQIGGMWTDDLAVRRRTRQISLLKKLEAAIAEAGINPQPIPDFIWIPALQEASLQDDETIQEKWANLLANAADPRRGAPVSQPFLAILKELTAREAHFLDELYEGMSKAGKQQHKRPNEFEFLKSHLADTYAKAGLSRRPKLSNLTGHEIKEGGDDLRADKAEFNASIDVLLRNRIIRESTKPEPINVSQVTSRINSGNLPRSIEVNATTRYEVTELGVQFIIACRAPAPKR